MCQWSYYTIQQLIPHNKSFHCGNQVTATRGSWKNVLRNVAVKLISLKIQASRCRCRGLSMNIAWQNKNLCGRAQRYFLRTWHVHNELIESTQCLRVRGSSWKEIGRVYPNTPRHPQLCVAYRHLWLSGGQEPSSESSGRAKKLQGNHTHTPWKNAMWQ